MLLAVWDMCTSFYIARAMIGRKKKLGKEVLSFSRFREQGMLIFLLNLILFILPNRKYA